MSWTWLRKPWKLFLVMVLSSWCSQTPAEAQFRRGFRGDYLGGFPLGYGIVFGAGASFARASPVNFLNQQAIANGSRATMGPVAHLPYARSTQSFHQHIYDMGPLERYDIDARREIEARIGRFSDGPARSQLRANRPRKPVPPRDVEPVPPKLLRRPDENRRIERHQIEAKQD
jgi:hypothetical protein